MNIEQYLCFNGYEILNAMRTETYLRRGLVPGWSGQAVPNPVPHAVPYVVISADAYSDTYGDTYTGVATTYYRQDIYTPQNILGYCADIDFSLDQPQFNYVDPKTDDAPWYTSARPESADFMGLLLRSSELDSVLSRAVNATGPVGGGLGRLAPKRRVLAITAVMFAASAKGMKYGERWLTDVLAGDQCDPLSDLGDLVILPACGAGFRTMKRTGIIDGPVWSEMGQDQSVPTCHAQIVEFQLSSELPWLLADGVEIAAGTAGTVTGLASTDDWVGDAGLQITIGAGSAGFSGTIKLTPLPAGYSCPTPGLPPALVYSVDGIPRGHQLIVDSAARQLREWDDSAKKWVSGFPRVTSNTGPFQWPEIPPCSDVCVDVSASFGSATVTVEQFNREL